MSPKTLLQRISDTSKSEEEGTTTIAGREITIAQAPHMKAEVERSKTILQNLQKARVARATVYSSEVVKTIEI